MKKLFNILLIIIIILSVPTFVASKTIKKYIKQLPSIDELQEYKPNLSTKIFDINGKLIDELFIEKRSYLTIDQIPKNLINAILATEDDNFYKHWGVSPSGIIRATIINSITGKFSQGGSTITQQLAKGLFLTREKKLTRKIKEAVLAVELERKYSKNEILEMYLNHIYLGHGVYGISMAADLYFRKNPAQLTLEECALIAGLPKAPEYYSPFKSKERALTRRNFVLTRMFKKKLITEKEFNEATKTPIKISDSIYKEKYASYFVEFIRQDLEQKYGDMLYKGGLKIYTTLDLDMQIAAVDSLEKHLAEFDKTKKEKITKYLETKKVGYLDDDIKNYKSLESYKNIQGSIIALDTKTGQIRALVGGRDFKQSQFNRAIQAKRQPGSSFKPIIYTAAIDKGIPPNFMLKDEPVVYYNNGQDWQLVGHSKDMSDVSPEIMKTLRLRDDGKTKKNSKDKKHKYDPLQIWMPSNYSNKYLGNITLRKSLEKSVNITSIKLLEKIGSTTACTYAKRLGITSNISPYLSLVLGAFVVTPLEITKAYATIANAGIKTEPYAIIRVCDKNDRILEERYSKEEIVLSEQTAYIMTNLLKGVVQHGTGKKALELGRPAAGKTGTTNDSTDVWFIGYTPQIVASVWVGYDNQKSIGQAQTGGSVACPIWTDFMKNALKHKPYLDFNVPTNIVFIPVDKKTGLRAFELNDKSYMEAFVKGTETEEFSDTSNLFENNTSSATITSATTTDDDDDDAGGF